MKALLPLFVFIDACGWEIIRDDPFLREAAPNRRRLTSMFGYSSTCVPSILSGRLPSEHRNWNYFVYDPANSPFRALRILKWLPEALTGRRIFRRQLSRFLKKKLGFRGYFDLYNLPFQHISLYNFTEKRSPLQPGGMNEGPNIFDYLEEQAAPYFVSDPEAPEESNLVALEAAIESESIDFAFQYWPGLDGLMHFVGNDSPKVPAKLRQYEEWIGRLMEAARKRYEEVHLYVFSDHGMANCDAFLDLRAEIERLGLRLPEDYAVVYDSTMARFWFFNEAARTKITECLGSVPQGRIVPDGELAEMGALFPDRYFGELIFLAQEGMLIVPSHMGARPIRAMHGYHPTDKHSYAALCTNERLLPESVEAITDIYGLMKSQADLAKQRNHTADSRAVDGNVRTGVFPPLRESVIPAI